MYQQRLFRLLLSPSLLSGLLVVLSSLLYMGYAGWTYIQDNQYFYDYLFGAYGTQTYLWAHPFVAPPWLAHIFKGSLAYFVLLITAGLVVGTLVYGVLRIVSAIRTQKADLSRELAIPSAQHDTIIAELVTRMALRAMALLGWGLYALFFAGTIVGAITLTLHLGIDSIQAGHIVVGVAQLAGDSLFLLAATHVHVYFLRLALLRPRVFYGDASVETVIESPH